MDPEPCGNWRKRVGRSRSKKCAKLPLAAECDQVQSLSNATRKIRKTKDNNWLLEWQKGKFSGAAQSDVELGLKPTSRAKSFLELRLKREVQGWLIVARSGHGHFSAYHERFGHEETGTYCVCGQKRAQLHPFSCTNAREHRLHLWCKKQQKQLALEEVLETPEGVTVFAKCAPATGLFHQRYRALGTSCEGEEDGTQEYNRIVFHSHIHSEQR